MDTFSTELIIDALDQRNPIAGALAMLLVCGCAGRRAGGDRTRDGEPPRVNIVLPGQNRMLPSSDSRREPTDLGGRVGSPERWTETVRGSFLATRRRVGARLAEAKREDRPMRPVREKHDLRYPGRGTRVRESGFSAPSIAVAGRNDETC